MAAAALLVKFLFPKSHSVSLQLPNVEPQWLMTFDSRIYEPPLVQAFISRVQRFAALVCESPTMPMVELMGMMEK